MLESYGFEFIPDRPRSLAEQIKLFGSASYIVSPHGAALSNMLWANETVRILELTSSAYAPDYFVNLSSFLRIRLDRLQSGAERDHWSNNAKDFWIDVKIVNRFIEKEWGLKK
jgi:capsular polysaccharide biosynthesis protein